VTEQELTRRATRRLAVLRHAEEITGNVALTCRYYGISRQIFSTWRRRGDAHGLDGLRDRSHRPLVSPNATRTEVVGKILYCASYHVGPVKIAMYLKRYHDIQISPSGVWRILKGLDLNRLPGLACLLRRIGHLADPTGTPDLVGARADADSAASDGLEAGLMAATLGYRPDGTSARLCFHLQPDSHDTDSLIKVLEQLAGSTEARWSRCGTAEFPLEPQDARPPGYPLRLADGGAAARLRA
jgi:hypothetical protein